MWSFRNWRRRRLLARQDIDRRAWEALLARPLFAGLEPQAQERLRQYTILFLHEKTFEPAGGLELTAEMVLEIAATACLPVLELGFDWLAGWRAVIVYPDEFRVDHEEVDEAGVVHHVDEVRSGESWHAGPLILSWADVLAGRESDGYNVVIHEIAHKLDALNGEWDGLPPLHPDMAVAAWSAAFTAAYEQLGAELDAGNLETAIDPYGAESPAEFFAVVSEALFELPELLAATYPEVHAQLRCFYRLGGDGGTRA